MKLIQNSKFKIQNFKLKFKTFNFLLVFLTFNFWFLTFPVPTYAQSPSPSPGVDIGKNFGFGGFTSLGEATSKLVVPIFSVAAALVVLYFLFGAFKYLTSAGDKEKVAEARQMIIQAIVGFIILMFAFLILQFLLSSLGFTGFQIIQGQ